MDYSKLSDFEINKRVAEIVYSIEVVADDFYAKDVPFAYHRDEQVFIFIDEPLSGAWRTYNPCKNPADAWPIIMKNCISLVWDCAEDASSDWWNAFDQFDYYRVQYQSNPLRAAMIVFLMKDDKHA